MLMLPSTNRTGLLLIRALALGTLVIFCFYPYHSSKTRGYLPRLAEWSGYSAPGHDGHSEVRRPFSPSACGSRPLCRNEDWTHGSWRPAAVKAESVSQMASMIGLQSDGSMVCFPTDNNDRPSKEDPEHLDRILNVGNWDYTPGDGCCTVSFEANDFIKRSLRSRVGFTLVGDSLQEQAWAVISDWIAPSSGPFKKVTKMPENIHKIWLDVDHPESAAIAAEAGVNISRLLQPLVTYYRDNTVLSRKEIDDCFLGHVSTYKSLVEDPGHETESVRLHTLWYEQWTRDLEDLECPILPDSLAKGIQEEENVMMVSYGPHWIWRELGVMRQDELIPGYARSVDIMLDKMEAVEGLDVRVLYRATTPGHHHCEASPEVDNQRSSPRWPAAKGDMPFNWDYFSEMNDAWKTKLEERASSVEFLDVWHLSITRPDSHKNPPFDCLHFCIPGPPVEWIRQTWHSLAISSRNSDYISLTG